jgi:hypothetical protein
VAELADENSVTFKVAADLEKVDALGKKKRRKLCWKKREKEVKDVRQ